MQYERHPIQDSPPWPLEARIRWLELHLAMLWDEVWWHQLPFWKRWWYLSQGFHSPIQKFYEINDGH
jgi:hypothetical protein